MDDRANLPSETIESQASTEGTTSRRRGDRRGLGSLQLRSKTWWIGYSFRGKRFRESSKSGERRDAVRLLRRRLAEISRGRLVGPDEERVTFADLKELVVASYRVNGRRSIRRAEIALARLGEVFEHDRALEIGADRVLRYVERRLAAKVKPATVRYEVAILRLGFSLAVKLGKLSQRPYLPAPRVENARQGFFEAGEFEELLKHLPAYVTGFVEFLYLTGWRFGEAVGLEWRQVDFEAGIVRLEPGTTKNDEARTFPFAVLPRLEAILRQERELTTKLERGTGQIIPLVFHHDGKPLRDLRGPWKKACKAIGLPNRIMHDFRRTAVRNLERAGVPRSVAMKLTGHKTESVYRRYAIVSEADLREGVAKLAKLHESQAVPVKAKVVALSGRKSSSAGTRRTHI